MSCGAIDIGCHVAAYFDPLLTFWGGVGAFIKSWWWLAFGAACMALGAHLGPVRTYAVISAGVVALIVRLWPQKDDEPDFETGEPEPPKPKKRKTIFGN
jgi:hypothetical protein